MSKYLVFARNIFEIFKRSPSYCFSQIWRSSYHIETSSLICSGLYMIRTSIMKELKFPCSLKTFHVTGLFLYLLKISENQRFSDVFRGCRKRLVVWNGPKIFLNVLHVNKSVRFKLTVVWHKIFWRHFRYKIFRRYVTKK